MKKINKNLIKEMSELMNELNLSNLEYSENGTSLKLSKNRTSNSFSEYEPKKNEFKNIQKKEIIDDNNQSIKAPLVGTVYLEPEPGAKPFVELGQSVKRGQVLLIIEAMKTMNEITAQKSGTIKKIFVKDANPVEFGEPLVLIE